MGKTILLVPSDPNSPLLAAGVAGAMPPRMELCSCGEWYAPAHFFTRRKHEAHRAPEGADVVALPLTFKGEPVPEGCDRAARCSDQPLRQRYLIEDADDIAMIYARRHPNTRVVTLGTDDV
jgi:hypothetical protein